MRARNALWAVLLISVLATALRVFLLQSGPDLDTDAYGHAVIGRYAMRSPTLLQVHWVWLPLWHFVMGGFGQLGLGMSAVRWLDTLLAACLPFLCFRTVERHRRAPADDETRRVAVLAAAFAAFFPLALTHGASAEPESAFAVLLLVACLSLERGRAWLAALALSVAVLVRFEAWASLPAFAVAALLLAKARGARAWLFAASAVVPPGLMIVGYILLHHHAYGAWLAFLRENAAFVREARSHAVSGVGPQPVWSWYVATLPWRTAGPIVLLALLGLVRFVRRAPVSYVCVGPWLLAFVSVGWVRQQHLGLDRHFFAVVPFYATAMAEGAVLVGSALGTLWTRAEAVLSVCLITLAFAFGVHHTRAHAAAARDAFLPERAVAARLAAAEPGPASVYCSLGKVEVLSGLAYDRFVEPEQILHATPRAFVVDESSRRDRWPREWRLVLQKDHVMLLASP